MVGHLGAGGDEGGDPALHVDRAAAVEQAAADLGRERIARPALARRHHVEMAGEAEMRARRVPRVANRFSTGPSGGSPATKRWTSKPSGVSAASSTSNTAPRRGRDARAGDQPAASSTGSIATVMRVRLASRRTEKRPCPSSTSTRSQRPTAPAIRCPMRAEMGEAPLSPPRAGRRASPDFGVSHVVLEPGGVSSQRHWHEGEDEFVVMLEGRGGAGRGGGRDRDARRRLRRLPQGRRQRPPSGQPQRPRPASSSRRQPDGEGDCHYPDIDLHLDDAAGHFTHKDGSALCLRRLILLDHPGLLLRRLDPFAHPGHGRGSPPYRRRRSGGRGRNR